MLLSLRSGATEKIKTSMSSTGVRDSTSAFILNKMVELGKKLRMRQAGSSVMLEHEVKAALESAFEDCLKGESVNDVMNPLLGMDSELSVILYGNIS